MSRSSSRRPTTNSRGSSSQGHRSLSVTEALQSIRLTETVGEHPGRPRRRASQWDEGSQHEETPYESTGYSSSYTLDPSLLTSSPFYGTSYSGQPTSTPNQYSNSVGTMSYQSYSPPTISSPFRQMPSLRTSSHYGYPNPRAEASMSRSMSGPSLPSVPSRTYEEIRSVGRAFVERRRHNVHRPRHQRKVLKRQELLPSTLRSSQVEDVSGSIDSFLAHSGSSNESYPAYVSTSTYPGSTSRPIYDPTYAPSYSGDSGPSPFTQTSRAYPATTHTGYGYGSNLSRRASGNGTADPVVIETPSKPQCWDHGCNGRQFSTFSNLLRHQREKSGSSAKSICQRCGAEFTRKTARDAHLAHDKCKQKSPAR